MTTTKNGTAGPDTLRADPEGSILNGLAGNDRLFGGIGVDYLYGGGDSDTLIGRGGADEFYGGPGDDYLYIDFLDTYLGVINGGPGLDRLIQLDDVGISLNLGAASIEIASTGAGNDILDGSTATTRLVVRSGGGNDSVEGGSGMNFLYGGPGDDGLGGGSNNDQILGQAGADRLFGYGGNDIIYIDDADTIFQGGDGYDRLFITGSVGRQITDSESFEAVKGGSGDDDYSYTSATVGLTFRGNAGADVANGGTQGDRFFGGPGDDILHGHNGNDIMFGDAGKDVLQGGEGNDILYFDAEDVTDPSLSYEISGGNGTDTAVVQGPAGVNYDMSIAQVEIFKGGAGNDIIHNQFSSTGPLKIRGLGGNDVLYGGQLDDYIEGGLGNDEMGNDVAFGFANGSDTFNGGPGIDTVYYNDSIEGLDGMSLQYSFNMLGPGRYTIQYVGAPGGDTDLLIDVEYVVFADGTFFIG